MCKKDFLTFLWRKTFWPSSEAGHTTQYERCPLQTQRKGTSSSLRHEAESEWTGQAVSPGLLHLSAHTFSDCHIFRTALTLFMKPTIKASVRVCVREKGVSLQLWETACMRTIETECVWETRTETERQERRKEKGREIPNREFNPWNQKRQKYL